MLKMWEILVPHTFNDGSEVPLAHHHKWDTCVRELVGGLTILSLSKGVWENSEGKIFRERVIPVHIACTEEQINQIIDLTMNHYDQLAVLAYQIGTNVIIRHRDT